MSNDDDTTAYKVVVNHEEQYSIWPVARENPPGWRDEGKQGLKAECLAHIKDIWTDMRPLSLRRQMEQDAGVPGAASHRAESEHEVDF
jgi:MbtH protein